MTRPEPNGASGPKTGRQPLWFHRTDDGLLLFAGLYESWQPEPDVWEPPYTIITTDTNATVGQVQSRMPVILPEECIDDRLHPREEDVEKLRGSFVSAAGELLISTPVSRRVNSVKSDDPELLTEAAEA